MQNKYFREKDFFTPAEAAYRWSLRRNTIIAALNRGKFDQYLENGLVRKFTMNGSADWYVSMKAMREVYGPEDKVQLIELWNQAGDKRSPRKAIHFNQQNLYVTDYDQDVPEDVLDELRSFDDYHEARRFIASKLGTPEMGQS